MVYIVFLRIQAIEGLLPLDLSANVVSCLIVGKCPQKIQEEYQ